MSGRTENLTPWQPGQSGNPAGRPKGSVSLTRMIREELEANGEEAARDVIRAAIDKARGGSVQHLRVILDRIDGPITHRIEGELSGGAFKAICKEAADKV